MKRSFCIQLIVAMSVLAANEASATILRVNEGTPCTTGCDGSTWGKAYEYLQDALDDANSGDEIWVAGGSYYPDEGSGVTGNERSETFNISSKLVGDEMSSNIFACSENGSPGSIWSSVFVPSSTPLSCGV